MDNIILDHRNHLTLSNTITIMKSKDNTNCKVHSYAHYKLSLINAHAMVFHYQAGEYHSRDNMYLNAQL